MENAGRKDHKTKDLYKIGEISKIYHIGPDSLRYYEKLGILTPIRGENGYRLYSIKDLWRLNVIRDMRELGFSMEQIKDYLSNRSIASTERLLMDEMNAIDKKISSLQSLRSDVATRLSTLAQSHKQTMGVVKTLELPPRNSYVIDAGYETDEQMDVLIKRLLNLAPNDLYIIGNNRIGSVIPRQAIRKKNYRGYNQVFIIDEDGDHTIPGGTYLSVSYHGSTEKNRRYIPMLIEEAKRLNLTPIGSVLELLWIDIHQSEDPMEHITELQLRCN